MVTGASGFIGAALTDHLRRKGKRVLAAGRPSSLLPRADMHVRVAWPTPEELRPLLEDEQVDVLYHCAAYGVAPDQRDMKTMFDANVRAAGAWVEVAAAFEMPAFVYVGSCSEYGSPCEEIPIDEDRPLDAVELYGASKAAGGQWARAVAQHLGVGFQWLRLFGVVGPGEPVHRLLPYLHNRLRAGHRVDLTPGQQWRDFLHIDDAVAGLSLAGEAARNGQFGTFNLCSGKGVKLRLVAEAVARAMGVSADLLDFGGRPYRADEPMWMVGDCSRFEALTDFRASIGIEDAVSRTISALDSRAERRNYERPNAGSS